MPGTEPADDKPTTRRRPPQKRTTSTRPAAKKTAAPPVAPEPAPPLEPSPPEPVVAPPPPPATDETAGSAAEHGGHEGGRFRTVIAVLIALISVMGAVATWRAEVAGSEAGKSDREGQIVAVTAEGQRQQFQASALAEARAAERSYAANRLYKFYNQEAAKATTTADADRLNNLSREENAVALKFLDFGFFRPDYVAHDPATQLPTDVQYDVNRAVADQMRENQVDTDTERWFEEADSQITTRNHLYGLDVLFVLALAMLAIAQVSHRRRRAVLWAVPGTGLFALTLVLLGMVVI